jgi:hypothetical protein
VEQNVILVKAKNTNFRKFITFPSSVHGKCILYSMEILEEFKGRSFARANKNPRIIMTGLKLSALKLKLAFLN